MGRCLILFSGIGEKGYICSYRQWMQKIKKEVISPNAPALLETKDKEGTLAKQLLAWHASFSYIFRQSYDCRFFNFL
jgi:hypothetical protein